MPKARKDGGSTNEGAPVAVEQGDYVAWRELIRAAKELGLPLSLEGSSAVEGPIFDRLSPAVTKTMAQIAADPAFTDTYAPVTGSTAYAGILNQISGNRTVFLGDSETNGDSSDLGIGGGTTITVGDAWPTFASVLSGQRIRYVVNAGVWGNTTAQMIARFAADVAAHSPNVVTIMGGRNDFTGSVPFATWQANIRTLVGLIRAIGATPVLCTMFPCSDTSGNRQGIATWNKWLRRYAESQKIILLDFYRQAVDPTTGGYLSSYGSADGIHPGRAGHALAGAYAAATLAPLLPTGGVALVDDVADTDYIFGTTALFTGALTDGRAAGWAQGAKPSGCTFSVVTDSAVVGNMQRINASGTASDSYVHQGSSLSGISSAEGDIVAVSAIVTNVNSGAVTELSSVKVAGGGKSYSIYRSGANVTRARIYYEFAIPAGTTGTGFDVQIHRDSGTGTFDVGQLTVVNLTRLGIVTP